MDVQGDVPLAGVTVTLTNADRGWSKKMQTDAKGGYLFIQLDPGSYTIKVEKDAYYSGTRPDIQVPLNQPKVVVPPFRLRKQVSTPTQQITVRGEQSKTAIVDLTSPDPEHAVLAYLSEPGATSMAALLDAALRWNFDSSVIQSLPLKGGRSFDQLALFSPGVFRVPFSSGDGPAVGIGVGTSGQFSVNGMRGRSNNFTVDGSDNNDEDIGVRRQGFVALAPQSIESVQEFQIVTAGFSGEAGRNNGSMVNAVSISGKKDHHGNVYGLFNGGAMNAGKYFDTQFVDVVNTAVLNGGRFSGKEESRKQFGGTAGGPLLKEKLFYFGSVERQNYNETTERHFVVPSSDERGLRTQSGFISIDKLADFFDIGGYYSAEAGKGIFSLYPLPNNSTGPFDKNDYAQVKQAEGDGTTASGKLDWIAGQSHRVFGRYNLTDDRSLIPFTSESIDSALGTSTRTQNVSLFMNSTFSKVGSAFRFSYGRTRLSFPPGKGSPLLFGSPPLSGVRAQYNRTIDTSYGRFGPFGATGPIGQLSIMPYSSIGVDVFNFPQGRADNTFQISEFITLSRARHALRFGFDLRRSQLNSFADRNSRPLVLFGYGSISSNCKINPLCIFSTSDGLLRGTDLAALGAPAGFLQTISTNPIPDTTIGLRITQTDLFVQDDWRLRPNLVLNAGLRYELQTVPSEVNERIERTFGLTPDRFTHMTPTGSAKNQSIINAGNKAFDTALAALQNFVGGRSTIYDPEWNRLAPRLGIAWDPKGDGKMSLRGGFSVAYDANLGAITSQSRNVFPTLIPINLDPNFKVPTGVVLNSPTFFEFGPTSTLLIRPGTLNTYNLGGDQFATGLGTLFTQAPPAPGVNLSSNGLAFTLPEKRYRASRAGQWVVTAERQLFSDYLVSLSYVGTSGRRLPRFSTPNAGLISTPILFSTFDNPLAIYDLPPVTSSFGTGRPTSGLGAYTVFENSGTSSFHSLQSSIQKRLSRGLQFRLHWTWAHALDEVSDPFDGRGFYSLPQRGSATQLERASANFDVRHRVVGYVVWNVPRLALTPALRGWKIAATGEFQTGQPFTVNTALDRNHDGNLTDRLDSSSGISFYPGDANPLRLTSGASSLSLIALDRQDGRLGRNTFRSDGIADVDVALARTFSLRERGNVELRIEAFNLFNRANFGIPVRTLESPGFGRSYDTQVDPRSIRISFKLSL